MATIQQFAYFQLDDNAFGSTQIPIYTMPYVIGEVFIDNVMPGDNIWLSAVIGGVENYQGYKSPLLIFNMYKAEVFIQGKEIYFSSLSLDKDGDVRNVHLSYVDTINEEAPSVRYILTVQQECSIKNIFIRGPITITALQIRV